MGSLVGSLAHIDLDQTAWFPGEWLTGAATLDFARRVEVTSFEAWLYGHESTVVKRKRGKHTVTYRESRPIVQEPLVAQRGGGPLFAPGRYEAGTYTLPFAAPLPPGVPPSFSRSAMMFSAGFYYNVYANVGVSWGRDPGANLPLVVVLPPHVPSTGPAQTAAPGTYFTGGTSIELAVDRGDAPREGLITGSVRVETTGKKRLRSVRVQLTEQVAGTAQGHGGATLRKPISEHVLGAGHCAFGEELRFELRVPPTTPPSYEGQIVSLLHGVRAEADLAFAVNPNAAVPFRVT